MKSSQQSHLALFSSILCALLALTPPAGAGEGPSDPEVEQLKKAVQELREQVQKQNQILEDHGIKSGQKSAKPSAETRAMTQDPVTLQQQSRRTSQAMFNPSLSAAVDTVSTFSRNDGVDLAVRAAEIMVDSNIDQYAHAYMILNAGTELDLEERTGSFRRNAEGTRLSLEEAAIQTTSLPHGLALKGGRYFADFTRMGKVHPP
jgi:hypothetical protein